MIVCPLSVGLLGWVTSIPQALDFKPSKPKVLGWFHVAAGYHIIGDYAVGHLGPALVSWAVLKFDSRNDESRGKTAVRHCEICVYIPMYINIHITDIDLQLYVQFKRFRENIPRMQKCLRYLLVGEVSVECIQIWWTSQIKGGWHRPNMKILFCVEFWMSWLRLVVHYFNFKLAFRTEQLFLK